MTARGLTQAQIVVSCAELCQATYDCHKASGARQLNRRSLEEWRTRLPHCHPKWPKPGRRGFLLFDQYHTTLPQSRVQDLSHETSGLWEKLSWSQVMKAHLMGTYLQNVLDTWERLGLHR